MKKVLALVLAFTLVFSSISFVFADEEVAVSDEGAALVTLGMLSGADGGYTAEYEAEELTRLQAAAAILKLKGLYEDAIAFDGVDNFADVADYAWVEGRNLMAYMKANPELGFIGDGVNFNPGAKIDEQSYYKVLLETLGYKQNVGEVVGDFAWEETLEFAEKVGLKPAGAEKFTVGDLAKATVAALKAETKDGKVYIDALIEAGKVTEEKAVVAGFKDEAPVLVEVAVKEVKAVGNSAVEVEFKEAVGEEAENLENYSIEGLEIVGAALARKKVVRLETAAQSVGKLYKLVVGEESYQFSGIAKVTGAPEIKERPESKDVDEVVITFTKKIDLETGSDVDNYTITGVEVVNAEVKDEKVTLTTEGLKNRTDYTVKVTNIKSIDGALKKSVSEKFRTNFDFTAPKLKEAKAETNNRVVLEFNKEVEQASAEDVDNYTIKLDTKDGDELEVLFIERDDDDKEFVTITTEPMEKNKKYEISVIDVADTRKVPNVMERAAKTTFTAVPEDKDGPDARTAEVISPTKILVTFTDKSKIDEDTVLDLGNYSSKNLEFEGVEKVTNKLGLFEALITVEEMDTDSKYELIVSGIADEFGNEMKKDKTFSSLVAKLDSFASAKLTNAIIIGESKIELTFAGILEKATAENIANYSVTKGIGVPTKAKYDKDTNVVTLTVNDLEDGRNEEYKVIVDGVKDMAGNELYFEKKIKKAATAWDGDAPKIESVEALNKYVVAITFDKKVNFETDAKLYLASIDKDYNVTNAAYLVLDAKDYDEDKTIVEFSNYGSKDLTGNVTYAVYKIVYGSDVDGGIKSLVGVPLLKDKIDYSDFTFDKTTEAADGVAVEKKIEQINGKQFKVTMERDVDYKKIGKDATAIAKGDVAKNVDFTFEIDGTDKNVVKFTIVSGKIEDDVDYYFEFRELLKDKHDIPVADEDEYYADSTSTTAIAKTILTGEYTDEDAPYIDDVIVKNRKKIEVVFDEYIKDVDYSGSFVLKNLDIEEKKANITFTTSVDKNKITLNLNKALEERYEYELSFIDGKNFVDFVGEVLKGKDQSSFYFYGTNLAD